MKKKIFGAALVVAIVVGAMTNVNLNKVSNKGDLTLANVEALAQVESGDYCDLYLHVGKSSRCWRRHDSPLMGTWYCDPTGNVKDYCSPLYTT